MNRSRVINDSIGEGFKIKSTIKTLADMNAFSLAHKLAMDVYKTSVDFPLNDKYSILAKLKRSSGSISAELSNQIESNTDEVIFIKRGRLLSSRIKEVKSWLLLANQSGYLNNSTYLELLKGYQDLGVRIYTRFFKQNSKSLFD